MAARLLERVGEVHAAVDAVLKCATVAETIRFFEACVFLAPDDLTPEKLTERGAAATSLKSRYAKTADIADQLADMLEAQEDERARLGLDGPDVATSATELFVAAGKNLPEFDTRVRGDLQDLHRQFVGDKYWPTVSGLLRTLASEHRQVQTRWLSDTTAATFHSKTRPGTRRGLLRAIGVHLAGRPGAWPVIDMSDQQVSDLADVLLGLPSGLSSKEQVKKTRKASAKSRSS